MEKTQYQAPSIEVIELEVEAMIAASGDGTPSQMKARGSLLDSDNDGPDTDFWSRKAPN